MNVPRVSVDHYHPPFHAFNPKEGRRRRLWLSEDKKPAWLREANGGWLTLLSAKRARISHPRAPSLSLPLSQDARSLPSLSQVF